MEEMWNQYFTSRSAEHRNVIVERYISLSKQVAYRVWKSLPESVTFEELISAGYLGLIEAVENFDISKRTDFKTYAYRLVWGRIKDYLRDIDTTTRVRRLKEKRLRAAYKSFDGVRPSDDQLASALEMPLDALSRFLFEAEPKPEVSLSKVNFITDNGREETVNDFLFDERTPDPQEVFLLKERIKILLRGANKVERLIVIGYYYENLTLKEVGESLNLSESRVSQIHTKLIARLQEQFA